jgi:hypothetical protein
MLAESSPSYRRKIPSQLRADTAPDGGNKMALAVSRNDVPRAWCETALAWL